MKESVENQIKALVESDESTENYVLISCSQADDLGHMVVNMIYGGDPCLTSYLLKSAQEHLDAHELEGMEFREPELS